MNRIINRMYMYIYIVELYMYCHSGGMYGMAVLSSHLEVLVVGIEYWYTPYYFYSCDQTKPFYHW